MVETKMLYSSSPP